MVVTLAFSFPFLRRTQGLCAVHFDSRTLPTILVTTADPPSMGDLRGHSDDANAQGPRLFPRRVTWAGRNTSSSIPRTLQISARSSNGYYLRSEWSFQKHPFFPTPKTSPFVGHNPGTIPPPPTDTISVCTGVQIISTVSGHCFCFSLRVHTHLMIVNS